ncbi:purine-binding chemotaxis protein CheW [Bacillus sp. BRMEA1]|uniref:chemotaxis protein CheW n=1 Tax=Neobacillus endophyticus TaxID=2738405 RepID=UPI0015638E6C|nr:chemotaxis protein CheW [Neobacillus endophyticus]NRD79373.1 purine-binding chemotaxis protein CheW [Neobacillus endophyticus]
MIGQVNDLKALIFNIGQEEYGVNIHQVVSIERLLPITPYPNRKAHVLGVVTVREIVTPVIDLRSALKGQTFETMDSSRIIIVQVNGKEIGLLVDATTDVMDLSSESIQHPQLMQANNISYIKGISKVSERLIILLDIEKLLEDTTNLDEL